MPLNPTRPIIYLITSGATTSQTTPECRQFSSILSLIKAAVASDISLIQLREKNLNARVLYELALSSVALTRGTQTRLLVNDRFDIALAAGAHGVHLTSRSMKANVIRETCGAEFLIGVSTHSLDEARAARDEGSDFVVFGPVFETESKRAFGEPQGVGNLKKVTMELSGFPVIAIGGISIDNLDESFDAGAAGVAAIRLLADPTMLPSVVRTIRQRWDTYAESEESF
jgi:thiamine-phosphate pyrophosphorylase